MSNPQFYVASNAWFYGNKRPSYKGLSNSYSAISRVKYDNAESLYRTDQRRPHAYSVPSSYSVPSAHYPTPSIKLVYAPTVIKPIYSQSLDDYNLKFYN